MPRPRFVAVPAELVRHLMPAAVCGGAGAPIRWHRLGIVGAWLIRVLGGLTPVEYTRGVLLRAS